MTSCCTGRCASTSFDDVGHRRRLVVDRHHDRKARLNVGVGFDFAHFWIMRPGVERADAGKDVPEATFNRQHSTSNMRRAVGQHQVGMGSSPSPAAEPGFPARRKEPHASRSALEFSYAQCRDFFRAAGMPPRQARMPCRYDGGAGTSAPLRGLSERRPPARRTTPCRCARGSRLLQSPPQNRRSCPCSNAAAERRGSVSACTFNSRSRRKYGRAFSGTGAHGGMAISP